MSKMWKGITEKELAKTVAPAQPDFKLSKSETNLSDFLQSGR